MPQDTTGLASGLTVADATLQALLEVIERDAYTINYRNNHSLVDIVLNEELDGLINAQIRDIQKDGLKIHLKLLDNDSIATVVHCTLEDLSKNEPIYTHGAGSSLDPKIAINRAITEAVQLRTSQIIILGNKEDFENDTEYKPYLEWAKGNEEFVGNLISHENDKKIGVGDIENHSKSNAYDDLELLLNDFKNREYNVYAVDLSRVDNEINVVRVIVPNYQPADDSLRRNTKRLMNNGGIRQTNNLFS